MEQGKFAGSISTIILPQIDETQPAGAQIYQALRAVILAMELPPGSAISEAELGAKIGASRTPVREALLRLRDEGLVRTVPSRGNFISKLSRHQILESQFLREGLEVANVRHLVRVGLSEEIKTLLDRNLEDQQRASQKDNYTSFHGFDDQFHLILARATGFERAAFVLEREKILLDRLRTLSLRFDGHLKRLVEEHKAILVAIMEQDEAKAIKATEIHCRSILDLLEDLSKRHQEFFDE